MASRKGEYFRRELSVSNAGGPVWLGVTVTSPREPTVTGNLFVPRTPEVFTHDLDGNLTSDGRWTYTWDAENRLLRVQSRSDTPQTSWRRVEWQYDALGRRIRQTTSNWLVQSNLWVVTEDLKFVSDPLLFGRHVVDLNASNNVPLRSYVWGLDLSGTIDSAGGVGGLLWVTLHTGSGPTAGTHFCAYDGNGNVVGLVSATTGTETARYEYGPFGEPIRATGPATTLNPFRFSTKRTCNTTELVLYEYRPYNPALGRWLSRDPIGRVMPHTSICLYNISLFQRMTPLVCICIIQVHTPGSSCSVCCKAINEPPGVKMGFRTFSQGKYYALWHAYLRVGDWTMGWAGRPYSEELDEEAERYDIDLKRRRTGKLPDGTPCRCATPEQIQACVTNPAHFPVGTYHPLLRNCGDWAGTLANKCCLKPEFRNRWYSPTCGWEKD
jgi:RHS repeat-associated protein